MTRCLGGRADAVAEQACDGKAIVDNFGFARRATIS